MNSYSEHLGGEVTSVINAKIETGVNQYLAALFPVALGITHEEVQKLDRSEKKGQL
ncbi:MAG: hypothetical protein GY786_19215 [Proteobacteria bacterium]|nr:hypothetical protein [Pseudomonadota bacterium]